MAKFTSYLVFLHLCITFSDLGTSNGVHQQFKIIELN